MVNAHIMEVYLNSISEVSRVQIENKKKQEMKKECEQIRSKLLFKGQLKPQEVKFQKKNIQGSISKISKIVIPIQTELNSELRRLENKDTLDNSEEMELLGFLEKLIILEKQVMEIGQLIGNANQESEYAQIELSNTDFQKFQGLLERINSRKNKIEKILPPLN